ncbi:lipopolysaccharide export system permease protein [Sphingopyxis panaciterrae]|uniref:LptF/LptG family permease n=1 Tax=Sphingopyxis panaciterrae TaxID=363841 RepID=UPI001424273E|nr:LptF/LptG family permease [Sphingopyxis panaciterrae]NIJ37516.1 lipopolysaccharide export system permease protein [Sphingopyxis panaciterrae]
MSAIDLYIARRLARPFAAVSIIIILLLTLENSRRLMTLLDNVEQPVAVLVKLMLYLVPEYLGIGLLIAVLLSVAVVFRSFALQGELDIFASIGLSPGRLLRVPLLFGLAVALFHAGLRAYVEPAGEQRLDALGASIALGNLGLSISPGEFLLPRPGTMFHVDSVDRGTGVFSGLFVQNRGLTVAAREAVVINGGQKGVLLQLFDGHVVTTGSSGHPELASFRTMAMPIELVAAKPSRLTPRHRNDRLMLGALWRVAARAPSASERIAARAALGSRLVTAAFVVLIPFFGFTLGIPPKRSTSALGLGVGILLIVGFVQTIVAIEDSAHALAPLLQLAVLFGFGCVASALLRLQSLRGPGTIEAMLVWASQPARYLTRGLQLDRLMMRLPADRPAMASAGR